MRRPHSLARLMSEMDEQIALFQWVDLAGNQVPELKLLHHIPNGGARDEREAARLKAAGVRPGIPDLFLPVARQSRHGLYIELKARGGRLSPDQHGWLLELDKQGYAACLCFGFEEAIATITRYLGIQKYAA